MTFLSLSDTSLCGRTCRSWLQVAHEVTPSKSIPFVLHLPEKRHPSPVIPSSQPPDARVQVDQLIRSPWRHHFTKAHIYFPPQEDTDVQDVLITLCTGLPNKLSELKLVGSVRGQFLMMGLTPILQYLDHCITRLDVIKLKLCQDDLAMVSQLCDLVTFNYLEDDVNLSFTKDATSFSLVRWTLGELTSFCKPNNQLKNLRDFKFELDTPLTMDHLECLKHLPLEAITRIGPERGIEVDALSGLTHFTCLRTLLVSFPRINGFAIFETLCNALQELVQLGVLGLAGYQFKSGELTALLQHQQKLNYLPLMAVEFESPECLKELSALTHLPLTRIAFKKCPMVNFDHLVQLAHLPHLTCGYHFGQSSIPIQILTPEEQAALTPPNSVVFPHLKEFHFNWTFQAPPG